MYKSSEKCVAKIDKIVVQCGCQAHVWRVRYSFLAYWLCRFALSVVGRWWHVMVFWDGIKCWRRRTPTSLDICTRTRMCLRGWWIRQFVRAYDDIAETMRIIMVLGKHDLRRTWLLFVWCLIWSCCFCTGWYSASPLDWRWSLGCVNILRRIECMNCSI